jgi:hypothetical protein
MIFKIEQIFLDLIYYDRENLFWSNCTEFYKLDESCLTIF